MRFILVMLVCPTLLSCSVWLDLDKSKLGGYQDATGDGTPEVTDDTPLDVEPDGDMPAEVEPDTPEDVTTDCPDVRECSGDEECDDDDVCTEDHCEMMCGVCTYTRLTGTMVAMDDYRIHDMEFNSNSPTKITWTGSIYGATWGWAPMTSTANGEIWFATFTEVGTELGAIRLTDNIENEYAPSIAWSGSEFGIAWNRTDTEARLQFERVGPDGSRAGIVDVVSTTYGMGEPDIVWGNGEYALAWNQMSSSSNDLWFARLDTNGTTIGAMTQVTDVGNPAAPSIVWTGSEYGIAFEDARHDIPPGDPVIMEIYFQRISSSGVRLVEDIRITNNDDRSHAPSLAWSGSEYAVAWHDYRGGEAPEVYFTRISGEGIKRGSDIKLTNEPSTFSTDASIVYGENEYGLVYNSNGELIFLRMDDEGTALGGRLAVSTPPEPPHPVLMAPDIVWNGTTSSVEYGIGWQGDAGEFFNLVKICAGE